MSHRRCYRDSFGCWFVALAGGLLLTATTTIVQADEVDFSRDILPILADKCFHCHGPDSANREADLRLDEEASAKRQIDGVTVIAPGNPAGSELVRRIMSSDVDQVMPPVDSERSLSLPEKKLLEQWIRDGAKWGRHWAFQAPVQPAVPVHANDTWSTGPIDRFLLTAMRKRGWKPAPRAEKAELLRRVTFDLTGLPPTLDELNAFLADDDEQAFERVVDRLLKSPRYGEHMAQMWLDAARYADTDGYQNDGPRSMWRWRDWVISAYNRHLPFDQFTIQQLAGDLLPKATLDQRLATGFNRNHRYNSEAGLVLEEFLLENAVDRVDTTSTVWMGLTMGCARCHDHKYDPFSQQEYYQLVSFFDNVPESGRAVKFGNSEPWMIAPTKEQQARLLVLERQAAATESEMQSAASQVDALMKKWLKQQEASDNRRDWPPSISQGLVRRYQFEPNEKLNQAAPVKNAKKAGKKANTVAAKKANGKQIEGKRISGVEGKAISSDGVHPVRLESAMALMCQNRFSISFWLYVDETNFKANAEKNGVARVILSQQAANTRRPGLAVELKDGRLRFSLITRWVAGVGSVESQDPLPVGEWTHVVLSNDGSQSATGMQISINGRQVETQILHNTNSNTGGAAKNSPLLFGKGVHGGTFSGGLDDLRFYNRTLRPIEIRQLGALRSIAGLISNWKTLTATENRLLRNWFWEHQSPPKWKQLWQANEKALAARESFLDSLPTSMIMREVDPPRPTFVRERGEYLRKKQQVFPGTPVSLGAMGDLPPNRLGFARWLVSGRHPLTARVAVNRYWQQFFGAGLVKSAEDFGVQGDAPSHPQLLDWLAVEFVRRGWNTQAIQKLIVMSAAYQQSSRISESGLAADPANTWLTRGPRRRLSAHELRDQALFLGGLLVERRGGPSVSPYQPQNLWREMSNMTYRQSKGDDLYRRSLYTIWKRTVLPPSMAVLDAADRESCIVRPKRTNTPLQALTLMNETAFVESARAFAERFLASKSDDRLGLMFRLATGRNPSQRERQLLQDVLREAEKEFGSQPQAARQLIKIGASSANPDIKPERLAAYTVVANLVLNLDEVLSKQ